VGSHTLIYRTATANPHGGGAEGWL
jgi:hypothetical protein